MPDAPMRLSTDDQVASGILDIIREAKEYAILVSPYLGYDAIIT